jgi:hypothetical protein
MLDTPPAGPAPASRRLHPLPKGAEPCPSSLLEVAYTQDDRGGEGSQGVGARAGAEVARCEAGVDHSSLLFAFGEDDVYTVVDLPDNAAALAVSLAVCAGAGADAQTVVLLTPMRGSPPPPGRWAIDPMNTNPGPGMPARGGLQPGGVDRSASKAGQ